MPDNPVPQYLFAMTGGGCVQVAVLDGNVAGALAGLSGVTAHAVFDTPPTPAEVAGALPLFELVRAPDAGSIAPRLIASAFNIIVENGDISEMTGVFNLVAAIYLDVGQYMLIFIEPQPDAEYFAVVSGDAPCLRIVDRQADYLVIEARDAVGGNFVDAGLISVQAYRF